MERVPPTLGGASSSSSVLRPFGTRKPLPSPSGPAARVLPRQHYVRACVHGGCIQAGVLWTSRSGSGA
eukprot:2709095-Prymnesium_polylepis.1